MVEITKEKKSFKEIMSETYEEHGLGATILAGTILLSAILGVGGIVGIILGLLGAVAEGWALMHLWQWFVTEQFGIRALTFWQAIGITTVTTLLTQQYVPQPEETKNKVAGPLAHQFLRPLMCVIIGWVIHAYFI